MSSSTSRKCVIAEKQGIASSVPSWQSRKSSSQKGNPRPTEKLGLKQNMAIIQKEISLAGSKGERRVLAVFDSGASYSCIQPELATELGLVDRLSKPLDFTTAKEGERLSATETTRLDFYINDYRFSDEFMLIPGLSEPVLIGAATLQKWRMKLDFETEEVIIDPKVTKLRLLLCSSTHKTAGGDS